MQVEKLDEIGVLVEGFNQLQSKLEKDYNHLNKLKIKAESNATLKSEFLANIPHEIRTAHKWDCGYELPCTPT